MEPVETVRAEAEAAKQARRREEESRREAQRAVERRAAEVRSRLQEARLPRSCPLGAFLLQDLEKS